MQLFNTAILSIVSLILFLMPLFPVSALNLDNTYLAQATCDRWVCRQTQDCIGMQEGYGSTEAEAREDLNRAIVRSRGSSTSPCNVTEPTKCFILSSPCSTPPPRPDEPPPDPKTKAGNYRLSDGAIFYSNGSDAYCTYQSSDHIILADMTDEEIRPATSFPSSFRNDRSCPVYLPPGAYRLVDGRIIASNGSAYCRYVSYSHYERKDGRPIRRLTGGIPLYAMENHFNCAQ